MNLPIQVSNCWSSLLKRKINCSSLSKLLKFWNNRSTLKNEMFLSVLFTIHSTKKCFSSSSAWVQNRQQRSSSLVFGRVYLPYSVAMVCELVLNWAMAVLYLWFLINSKDVSMPNSCLILQYIPRIGFLWIFWTSSLYWCVHLPKTDR